MTTITMTTTMIITMIIILSNIFDRLTDEEENLFDGGLAVTNARTTHFKTQMIDLSKLQNKHSKKRV